MKAIKISSVVVGFIVLLFVLHDVLLGRWFAFDLHQALGFSSVYQKNMVIEMIVAYGSAFVFLIFSLILVRRFKQNYKPKWTYGLTQVGAGILGWIVGYMIGRINPTTWLLFFSHTSFQKTDPIFHMNYAFYVYQLPVIYAFLTRVLLTCVYFFIVSVSVWGISVVNNNNDEEIEKKSIPLLHFVGFLTFVAFLTLAADTFLARYRAMYTSQDGGFLFGPGYTKTHFSITVAVWIHALLLVAIAVSALIASFRFQGWAGEKIWRMTKYPVFSFAGYFFSLIGTAIVGGSMNQFYVHPNQESAELPYITRTIQATRWGANIENITMKTFSPKTTLTSAMVQKNQSLLDNVRINDIRQTQNIYNQLQSFKNYFQFAPAIADRYHGKEVYVDVRQLDSQQLPVQTWINQTLVYTHGYGIVASPVNQFDKNGLPTMLAKNTPQQSANPLPKITQPEIYFGTALSSEVIAPSKQAEFDYPTQNGIHTSHYQGGYGLSIASHRWLLTLATGSFKYLTSDQITSKSELLFDRNMINRAEDIAPFLIYSNNAFPFVNQKGQIEWMMNAFTATGNIPYAQSYGNGYKYLRNSVKVVMNAYTGKMTYYVVEPKDPMIQSLMTLYPHLFTTTVPADIRAHFRYSQYLFSIQAQALRRYHMTNPDTFYNQDDLWDEATQIYNQNQTETRPPIFQMIQLPDQKKPTFVLSELFTPHQKMNLISWLVVGNDGSQYGKFSLYQFPQSNLTFGPMQAENQIDSDPSVSSQLTLWNQQGSHVIRGDILMVPLAKTMLYIEPIYLIADRSGSLPQLQRVVIDFNQTVYMGDSLGGALHQMLTATSPNQPTSNTPTPSKTSGLSVPTLAQQANQLFQQYRTDTTHNQYAKAGADLQELQQVLQSIVKDEQTSKK